MMFPIGPLGQMPSLSRYTIITLGFAVKDETAAQSILDRAANEIVDSFPWLAGQVVVEPAADKVLSSGIFKIIDYKPHDGKSKFVHVKDCKNLCPGFDDLLKSRAPASMLDGSIICPAYGASSLYPEDVVKPVVIMQANLIKGGLLLTVCTHHCVMDANGNEQFILQFASLCRSEKLSEENIRFGNADQNTIVPPLKPGQDPESLELYRCPSKLGAPHKMWPPPPFTGLWKTFRFTHAKVAELKDQASALCSPDSDVKYISSDDAVSTFIWTRMATIRSAWLPGDSTTMLYRAVNGRRKLEPEIHAGYMGHSILMWPTKLPIHNVINDDFSSTVIKVRRSLMEVNDNHMRSFFYLLQGEKDKTTINYGAKVNVKSDMLITSFVAQKLYKINFGDILGKPVRKFRDSLNMPHANMCSRHLIHNAYSKVIQYFIRRPNLPDGINLYYMMPATEEGDVDLIAGLSEEEFNSLQKDRKWKEYAELIG